MSEAALNSSTRPGLRLVWWSIGLFVVLAIAAVFWAIDQFETMLTAAATSALAAEGLEVDVEFAGRDAVLSGTVGAEILVDQAVQIITEVTGVRTVSGLLLLVSATNSRTTTTTAPPEIFPAVVEVAISDGVVTLAGLVSPADRVALVSAAEEVFGATGVQDRLQAEDNVAVPDWLVRLPDVFAELEAVDDGTIVVSDQGLEIVGTVTSQDAVERVGIRLAQITSLQVTNQLSFVTLDAPSISAIASGRALTLIGTLPSQADIDAIIAAASAHFDGVDNQLIVGQVTSEGWVRLMPVLVERLGTWPSWIVNIDRDASTIGGFAPSTAALDALSTDVLGQVDLEWDLGALEVDPEVLAGELTDAIAGQINFSSGSAVLSRDSTGVLDRVIEALVRNASARLQVRGHTDDRGSAGANQRLSEDRARAVVNYLVAGGIDPERLTALGLGEAEPIADNGTLEGRAQNRRIEFVVRSEGGEG